MIKLKKINRCVAAATAISIVSALGLSSAAAAATVESREEQGPPGKALLRVIDPLDESNELRIKLVGDSGAYFHFEVVDFATPVTAGPGCQAGGEAASAVVCWVHRPVEGWTTSLFLNIAGGKNFFDASQLSLHPDLPITAIGGPGQDVFVSGGGNDVLDPGAGEDAVYGNPGDDEILDPASPDGGDVYEGGAGTDRVSYARRSVPMHLAGNFRSTADGDQLGSISIVRGGTADDTLVDGSSPDNASAPNFTMLEGGPGDDILQGGVAGGALLGGPGDDSLYGGVYYKPAIEKGLAPPPPPNHLVGEAGNDVVYGSSTVDLVELGEGDDTAYGQAGNDSLDGGPGRDLLDGDEDADLVIGDADSDRLFGGSGEDRVFAARKVAAGAPHPLTSGPYDGRDDVGCGPDRDLAIANPWDRVRGCEKVRRQPKPKRRRRR